MSPPATLSRQAAAEQPNTGRYRTRTQPGEGMTKMPTTDEDRTEFIGSQVGGKSVINYSYTDNPWLLMMWDIRYFFIFAWALPWVVWPVRPCPGGHFDELSFTRANMFCIIVHFVLVVMQLFFILTLPLLVLFPVWTVAAYVAVFFTVNWLLCRLLNGNSLTYNSDPKYAEPRKEHEHEKWIFLNGVAVGEAWMMSNINRLALTFKRPIMGIHNKTDGIIFDVIECLIQRNFNYATTDVREAYRSVKEHLYDTQYNKVVFILHSQGGIEGGMVLDWLLQELPQDLLAKLEVYTFGCAASHFNNPHRTEESRKTEQDILDLRVSSRETSTVTTQPLTDSPLEMKSPPLNQKPSSSNGHVPANGETKDKSHHHHRPAPPPSISTATNEEKNLGRAAVAAANRAIGHIEHYAHTTDFVALWGVLHFVTSETANIMMPRYMGRVFSRTSSRGGHQLSQHYLNGVFPLERRRNTSGDENDDQDEFVGCADTNAFMESVVEQGRDGSEREDAREGFLNNWAMMELAGRRGSSGLVKQEVTVRGSFHGEELDGDGKIRVKNLSRLWLYRNGRKPPEIPGGLAPGADGVVRAGTL